MLDELWKTNVGSGFSAPPMTFEVDSKQYVAIASGPSGGGAQSKLVLTPELGIVPPDVRSSRTAQRDGAMDVRAMKRQPAGQALRPSHAVDLCDVSRRADLAEPRCKEGLELSAKVGDGMGD